MEEVKRTKAEYRSSIRSKAMIREALLSLMLEKNFDKISITDIVRKADINRGTFYAHFKNTNEVLNSISMSIVDEIVACLRDVDNAQLLTNPRLFLDPVSKYLAENEESVTKLLKIDKFADILESVRNLCLKSIMSEFSWLEDEDFRLLAVTLDYCISGIMTLYIDILLKRIFIDIKDSAEYIARILQPQVEIYGKLFSRRSKSQENKG